MNKECLEISATPGSLLSCSSHFQISSSVLVLLSGLQSRILSLPNISGKRCRSVACDALPASLAAQSAAVVGKSPAAVNLLLNDCTEFKDFSTFPECRLLGQVESVTQHQCTCFYLDTSLSHICCTAFLRGSLLS